MKPSTALFDLIKSLSKSEKRYFKLIASMQKGNKNYLKLFNLIEREKSYDESFVKSVFKNEKFIRQLTFTKNYLYNLILKTLYSYHGKNSVENRLNDLIFRCNYFYRNAMYLEFKYSVGLGKKISLDYERYGYFLQFVSLEKTLLTEKHFPRIDEKAILAEEELVIEKISNLSVYDSFVAMLNGIYHEEGRVRDKTLFNYIERIKKSPLLTSEQYALSSLAKERYYYLLQLISDIYGDFGRMHDYCRKRLNIISSNPKPFQDRTHNYWRDVLMHLILFSIRFNRQKQLIKYLSLLEEHTSNAPSDRVYLFLAESYLSVNLIINEKRWDRIKAMMGTVEKGLQLYKGKIDSNFEILLYSAFVSMYSESGDFVSALKYINLLLNHPHISVRRDIEFNVRLLNLIIHYELKHMDYLEHLILSTYRFFYRRKKIFKLEYQVIKFIKHLRNVRSNDDLTESFKMLRKELTLIRKKPHQRNIFHYFDYLKWVDRRLTQIKKKA